MMQRLGIEPGGGMVPHFGLSYATAFHRCETCASKDECREWLDRMPASVSFAPRFCPNADLLFELQFDCPGGSHFGAEYDARCGIRRRSLRPLHTDWVAPL
jgi:hypothetical protein